MSYSLRIHLVCSAALSAFLAASVGWSQAIQSQSARQDPGEQILQVNAALPSPRLSPLAASEVKLLPGLFHERRQLTKAYLTRLKTENLLQNHLLEAGVRIDRPIEQMHQGWESPHCQLRGHFAGHWLAAAAQFAVSDHDSFLAARVEEAVRELARCQQLNHGQWVGSIPEKYFAILADGKPIWSPQYTVHKTLMGLLETYRLTKDETALAILKHAADWFTAWTEQMIREGKGAAVYGGECAGMLELWADLYAVTGNPRHLRLAARYSAPDLFQELLTGGDPLSNDHTNASIPWIHGAARLYEVTGDTRFRQIVEAFWKQGVDARGMLATTGNNAGEFWIPPQQFGRFLGSRTQEHCTVYNMIRVAQYLFRWTGEARYADYIERALYNGILAQQNPHTGLIAYFLPLQAGAKKIWGSELNDFWCCHGTLVQAQATFEDLIYYRTGDAVTVRQFIPSEATFGKLGNQIRITQTTDPTNNRANFTRQDDVTHFAVELLIASEKAGAWTLRVRQPAWALQTGEVAVDGQPVSASVSKDGFLEIAREWKSSRVRVVFAKRVVQEPLPGDRSRIALVDGPVVLAALTDREFQLVAHDPISPRYEHQYVEGRDWQSGHYVVRTAHGALPVKPLYEIADETYTVYLTAP